ncbi:MAG: hypothetical protein ACKV2V_07615, partial [Blastocatellia bacterium]
TVAAAKDPAEITSIEAGGVATVPHRDSVADLPVRHIDRNEDPWKPMQTRAGGLSLRKVSAASEAATLSRLRYCRGGHGSG